MPKLKGKAQAQIENRSENRIWERLQKRFAVRVLIRLKAIADAAVFCIFLFPFVVIITEIEFDVPAYSLLVPAQQRRFILFIAHGKIETVLGVKAHGLAIDCNLYALFRFRLWNRVLRAQKLVDGNAVHAGQQNEVIRIGRSFRPFPLAHSLPGKPKARRKLLL